VAAFENAKPCFLKEVFGTFAIGSEVKQVAEEAKLVLLDQAIEDLRVATLELLGESLGVIGHECGEA